MPVNAAALSSTPTPPDAGSIRGDDWPERPFPPVQGVRAADLAIVFDRSAVRAIYLHGRETIDLEICGVLVGRLGRDAQGPFVHVHDVIRGEHAGNQAGQVTFTAETWGHIQQAMDRRGPDERIVGWYHTHPDFGIFLSSMDMFIHRHFFNLPWQLAFVYDPIRQKQGLFVWRSGDPVEEAFLMHENMPSADPPPVFLKGPPRTLGPQPLDRSVELARQLQGLEHKLCWLGAGLLFALVLAVFWPLALVLLAGAHSGQPQATDAPATTKTVVPPPTTKTAPPVVLNEPRPADTNPPPRPLIDEDELAKELFRNNLNAYVTIVLQHQPWAAAACSSYFLMDPKKHPQDKPGKMP